MPRTHRIRRNIGLSMVVIVGLVATACSAQDADPTTTEPEPTTTSAPEPTTTTEPVTTTTGATTSTAPPTTVVTDTNDLASGSGCKPGTTDGLPDGEWYGFIVDLDATQIDFDLACWFTGEAATTAASEDGEESPPPNDYYVRNENDTVRALDVADSAQVEYLANGGDPNSVTTSSYTDWASEWEDDGLMTGYWLTVEEGEVTSVVQQYVP